MIRSILSLAVGFVLGAVAASIEPPEPDLRPRCTSVCRWYQVIHERYGGLCLAGQAQCVIPGHSHCLLESGPDVQEVQS